MVSDPVNKTFEKLDINIKDIEQQVEDVLNDDIYWFPVRHHSPVVSRILIETIKRRKPKLIFIEGPHEAEGLIPFLVDKKTKPPVAIYSSFVDQNNTTQLSGVITPAEDIPARFSMWYPLMSYSPEYVALIAGSELGAKTHFIDLPHYKDSISRLSLGKGSREEAKPEKSDSKDGDSESSESDKDQQKDLDPQKIDPESFDLDKIYNPEDAIVRSNFFKTLANVAGFRSWDEAWDSMFELQEFDDIEHFRKEFALFCASVRATSNDKLMELDGTINREIHMMQVIDRVRNKEGVQPKDCMVVTGGIHSFMSKEVNDREWLELDGKVYNTVVPYSFFRISQLSGYGAGNRAPKYYQALWDESKKNGGDSTNLLGSHVISVFKEARKLGEVISSADAISVSQHAEFLSRLRNRKKPILDDIHDAIITCCCKGNPEEDGINLYRAMDKANIGTKIGKVTDKIGTLPIVSDFNNQIAELELGELLEDEKRMTLRLDKREEFDLRRSAFLHQLRFLEVPIGGKTGDDTTDLDTGKIFLEVWKLKWDPSIEAKLIEQNLLGDCVRSASIAKLELAVAENLDHSGKLCRILTRTIDMDLPDLITKIHAVCGKAIDEDNRFISLADALSSLLVLDKYSDLKELSRNTLSDLIFRAYNRACFAVLDIVSAPEEQQEQIAEGLLNLSEALLRGRDMNLDRDLLIENVNTAYQESEVPFLKGLFLGLLIELKEKDSDTLAQEIVALSKSPREEMVKAGDLIFGVMSISKTSILIGAESLIEAIDCLLKAAAWEDFLTILPRLRAAFEKLHEGQRISIAEQVAQKYGLIDSKVLKEFVTSSSVAVKLAKIDEKVRVIMKDWEF